jgi:UBX domain-containing protein 1
MRLGRCGDWIAIWCSLRFNLDHTVADIRRFIHASRPDMPATYALMTAFPSAQLADDSQTIADAALQNAVVVQKL